MISFTEICDSIRTYFPEFDEGLIKKSYFFSAYHHRNQTRLSGERYLSHPLSVAKILTQLKADDRTVSAGILHDVAEDTPATIEDIERYFGSEISTLVNGVTKLSKVKFESQDEKQSENLRRMVFFTAKDIRVVLIKLADRLDNMRTVNYLPPDRRQKISQETLDIFVPISHRLGIDWLKSELEDLCFSTLKPDLYESIKRKLENISIYKQKFIEATSEKLRNILAKEGFKVHIQGRLKNVYSIHKKILRDGIDLEDIYDIVGFRIITQSIKECYEVLGILHLYFKPIPGRFKDYIALPKPNGYRSLHTTVIQEDGQKIEIQIRTEKMNTENENGISSHWIYKSDTYLSEKEIERFAWLKSIINISKSTKESSVFLENFKESLYPDETYVFTPKGDIKVLPKGATVLDFAFAVHTKLGESCVGAKINGKLQPMDCVLSDGDVVEIITSKAQKPRRAWLSFVTTQRAKEKIRSFVRKEERDTFRSIGEDTIRKEMKRYGLRIENLVKNGAMAKALDMMSVKTLEELYYQVGCGKISPSSVLRNIRKIIVTGEEKIEEKEQEKEKEYFEISDMLSRLASCCNPIPGEKLVGYVSRGKGMIIHNEECQVVKNLEPERIVPIQDLLYHIKESVPTKLEVIAENNQKVIQDIVSYVSHTGRKIKELNFRVDGARLHADLKIFVKNKDDLVKVLKEIEKIKGVVQATRYTEKYKGN